MKNNITLIIILALFTVSLSAANKWHDFNVEKSKLFYTLNSPHLKISSTLKRAETKKITRKLYSLIKNIDYIYPVKFSQINEQLKCFLFQEKRDYYKFVKNNKDYSAKHAGGYFNPARGEMVLFWKGNRDKTLQVLLHETAHFYTKKSFKRIPQAINEGFSTYLEVCGSSSGSIKIGTVNNYYHKLFIKQAAQRTLLPLYKLLTIRGYSHNYLEKGFTVNQYAQSWALIWFCLSGPVQEVRDNFKKYLEYIKIKDDPDGTVFTRMVINKTPNYENIWLKTMINQSLKPTAFRNQKV